MGKNREMVYIVSGLERSGTSMMMRILYMGGFHIAMGNSRKPDIHNPHGYFELYNGKIIKELIDGNVDMKQYANKALKVTSQGLRYLPDDVDYKVIFMWRDYKELVMSMKKMGAEVTEDQLREEENNLLGYLIGKKIILVGYGEVLKDPHRSVKKVSEFVGGLDIDKAVKAVDNKLYRNIRSCNG